MKFVPVLGPTQSPNQLEPGALSPGVKRQVYESDNSPPSNAELKNAWIYISTTPYVLMMWCLIKHRDNFTFLTFVTGAGIAQSV
jgi:hypothetical protein